MRQWKLFTYVLLTAWTGLLAAGPSFADTTPEDAVAAYIDGVTAQDFDAILASTAVDKMSEKFDFAAHVDRLHALLASAPSPTNDPLFIEINRADFAAQIAGQVKFLTYGLMTTSEILDGKAVQMDAAGADQFASVVRANRLTGLELVKVGVPSPELLNSERYQANAIKMAKVYGADSSTERVALLAFEGLNFAIGFSLLLYGDDWTVMGQASPISGFDWLGAPKRVTPQEFEDMLK